LSDRIEAHAYARAGLMGNPSDAYGGKAVAGELRGFAATVTLVPSDGIELLPGPGDRPQFGSIRALADHVHQHGFYGGLRLLTASSKAFADHCSLRGIELDERGFQMSYRSDIPRQVGLAGSSAIIVATLKALCEFYDVQINRQHLPTLALEVETRELGIPAGLMDRVVQVWGGLVSMDLRKQAMTEQGGYQCGLYEQLDSALIPPLYVAYGLDHAEPTEVTHGSLSRRYLEGDPKVLDAMAALAELVDLAVLALRERDVVRFGELMDRNFDLRQSVSDVATQHVRMIEVARQAGAPAKFAGSGGAIVGVLPDHDVHDRLEAGMSAIGCRVVVPNQNAAGAS